MDKGTVIKVSGLSKTYSLNEELIGLSFTKRLKDFFTLKARNNKQTFYALKDINFEIKQGETVGIIGRNGAGKSTLLKILSQVTTPTTGEIIINGKIASVLEIGMGFHPELTGRENIYLSATMLGISKKTIKEKFDQIVEFSGVRKFIDEPVKRYSSGMYVRLAFAVVINIDADILLFDEVLTVGDLAFQMQCKKKIFELSKQDRTIILVSHNINDIIQLSNRIIYLENGLLSDIQPSEIISDYYEKSLSAQSSLTEHQENKFTNITHKSWTNDFPGDASIRIKSIYLKINNKTDETIKSNESFEICIEFEKLTNNDFYDIGVILSTNNIPFLGAHTLISDINIKDYFDAGKYIARVVLDPNFFNETILSVGFSVSKNNESIICSDFNALQFRIELFTTFEQDEYYNNIPKSFFPLRPKLNWSIIKLSHNKDIG